MNENLKQFQELNSFAAQLKEHKKYFQLLINTAKHITGASVCRINIFLGYSHWVVTLFEGQVKFITREECIIQDRSEIEDLYEIADLSKEQAYLNHPFLVNTPGYRYFCSAQLITSDHKHVGTISVLDTTAGRMNEEQKKQFLNIARLVVNKIENEVRYDELSSKLDKLNDSILKLNHDLRSPINGIVGITDLLLDDKEALKDKIDEIEMIRNSARALSDIIDGALAITNQNSKSDHLLAKKSVTSVLSKIDNLYRPVVQSKQISLNFINKVDTDAAVPHYLFIKLLQIMGNLVANAIKFTAAGGAVEVGMSINKSNNRNRLTIYVKDNGVSMNNSQIHAFNENQPITRSVGTGGEKSFGIGLQHIKQMVREEGGEITVQSEKGAGTTFELSIPLTSTRIDGEINPGLLNSLSSSKSVDYLDLSGI